MTQPTTEQLAAMIDPMVREYVDAAIKEAISKARINFTTQAESMRDTNVYLESRMAEMELFERQVRSHLGIYVPEFKEQA